MTNSATDRRIVVGVDGSESSRHALRWAIDQAALTGATVDAVNAWELPTYAGMAPVVDTGDEAEALSKAGEQMLAETLTAVSGDHPTVAIRSRVVQGHAAFELLRAAEGADLLVLGCRGHGGFIGVLLGSVSQYCVYHANCPVVVVRGAYCAGDGGT
ncbi:universal stress protein [Planosporangium sp. 12N6]|uniref:universal stress protein n=1 Tax=Planosporangium spinosum TaxID=3402278 RepID=UPI003CF453C9